MSERKERKDRTDKVVCIFIYEYDEARCLKAMGAVLREVKPEWFPALPTSPDALMIRSMMRSTAGKTDNVPATQAGRE